MNYKKINIKNILLKYSTPTRDILIKILIEPLACLLTLFLLRTKITANQVTISNLIISILFLVISITTNYNFIYLGITIFFILDFIDGKIARIKGLSNNFGIKLDFIIDRLIFSFYSIFFFFYQLEINNKLNYYLSIYVLVYISKDFYELISKKRKKKKLKKNYQYNNIFNYYFNYKNLIIERVSTPILILVISYFTMNYELAYILGILSIYMKNYMSFIKRKILNL